MAVQSRWRVFTITFYLACNRAGGGWALAGSARWECCLPALPSCVLPRLLCGTLSGVRRSHARTYILHGFAPTTHLVGGHGSARSSKRYQNCPTASAENVTLPE